MQSSSGQAESYIQSRFSIVSLRSVNVVVNSVSVLQCWETFFNLQSNSQLKNDSSRMNKLVSNSRTRVLLTCRTWFAHPQRGVLTAAPNTPKRRPASLNPPPPQRTESRRHRSGGAGMNVFDREMKRRQRKWAASLQGSQQFDYLRDEVMPSISPQVQLI